ncbi:MAG: 3-phosphoserine/phosphohydroxythreonine transaminase [candidate division Zixibacteria bacterium]|nr:3-phosphoserine/phosphohydroxythreonine transaminase [candidate division Zixibacteria bacterium]
MGRVFNFNPGPSTLPLDVLKIVQAELLDYRGTGMSIIESSHRSPEYDEINESAMSLARELFGLGDDYHVLFMTGGASSQFAFIPLNFLNDGQVGAYVDTGSWSAKAIKEANIIGTAEVIASSKAAEYKFIPNMSDITIPGNAAYLHITSNNTIKGTQYHEWPNAGAVPLVCDMSSDIASRVLDFTKFSLIYAGAQKNLGPSGVTLVLIRDEFLQKCKDGLPTMFSYKTHAEQKSLYNTPPSLCVYIMKLVFEWIKNQGGLAAVEKVNRAKKDAIYGMIDGNPDFYKGTVQPGSRSWMNITLRLPSEDLEKKFISEAKAAGFVGLKGHRSVGGVRVSLYNALPLEGAQRLAEFMSDFMKKNK